MLGFGRIAFMADRSRQQTLERWIPRAGLSGAQRIHVTDGGIDTRPMLFELGAVAAVAIQLCDRVDQFAVTVVLRHWIGATMIHATRYFAIGKLMRRVPTRVFAYCIGFAKSQQGVCDHRAVADP